MVSGATADAKPVVAQYGEDAIPHHAKQIKAECKYEEGDCLGCLDNVVFCANTCAQATANSLMPLHWTLLLWKEER